MAGRSAAKRTTPRRTAGAQREGKASQLKQNNTTTVTSPSKEEISSGSSSGVKGHWDQLLKFLNQVKVEWRRVSWPSTTELAGATKVVLWTLFVFSLYLGVLDWVFIKIFSWGPIRRR